MKSYSDLLNLTASRKKDLKKGALQYKGVAKQYGEKLSNNTQDEVDFKSLDETYRDVQENLANGNIDKVVALADKVGLVDLAKTENRLTVFILESMKNKDLQVKDLQVQQKIGFYNEICKSICEVRMIGMRVKLFQHLQEDFSEQSKQRLSYIIQNSKEKVLEKLLPWSKPQLRALLRDSEVRGFMEKIEQIKDKAQQLTNQNELLKAEGMLGRVIN